MKLGLVNMDGIMDILQTEAKLVEVHFNQVANDLKWSDLFPQYIDEDSPSKCPEIPMPKFEDYEDLDVVVAKVPCNEFREDGGMRDVFRLQINLVVANLLVRSGRKENGGNYRPKLAVFIGSCGPMWELFSCDELLWHGGNSWIYMPQLKRIKQKVLMPVGTCQLAPPYAQLGEELWRSHNYNNTHSQPREAYVTVLHSSEAYVCGAIALAQSIIQSNSTKDLVLLADDHISPKSIKGLQSAGWKIKRIQRIRSPLSEKDAYNEWNYSKLRIWQLKEYDKVMFIDSDFIVTKNIDEFFIYPQFSAVENNKHIFNSGLMLVEPSECTFKTLMKKRLVVASYNGGDQGFLNEMFTWWHRLPTKLNYLKYFIDIDDQVRKIPKDLYAVHYLGLKPWACYRDYDCNWDKELFQIFASDSAHERWWDVYDAMPEKLREYCSLSPEMDARIWKYRRIAEEGNYTDGHWKINVKDPRQRFT
ncbi:hypothetical protein RD792_011748 [Penstemon davidsonii]|uniref:Hexosyltransferase n=1 Tax=Penstemon davidsonii TaxID=160366 RepID=A0ABR0CUX9_9LAMI|nr:hypothetical protein RD792_011748 [Penstemon davidsonii]